MLDGNEYIVPNVGKAALWDFGMSTMVGQNADNNLVEYFGRNEWKIQSEPNRFMDIFLLLKAFIILERYLGPDTKKFANKYTNGIPWDEQRLAKNVEYYALDEMLKDPYFNEFRNGDLPDRDIIETYSDTLVETKELSNLNPFVGTDLRYSDNKFICDDYNDLYYVVYKDSQLNDSHRVNCNANTNYVGAYSEISKSYGIKFLDMVIANDGEDQYLREKIFNLYDYIYEEYVQRMNVPIEMTENLAMVIMDKVTFYILKERKFIIYQYDIQMSTKVALDLIIQFNNYSYHYDVERFLKSI